MYTCAHCKVISCCDENKENMPKNCPMREEGFFEETIKEYEKEENKDFYINSSHIEAEGYCVWPRLKETIEFCKKNNYKKVGMAFCKGLHSEALTIAKVFKDHDIEIVSVMCKTGGVPKEEIGIKDSEKVRPGTYEIMCNPISQAKLLNKAKTDFNILVGLCVGHDSLFYKYSDAMVTTLITKDRALGHNPVAAVYLADGYMKNRLK